MLLKLIRYQYNHTVEIENSIGMQSLKTRRLEPMRYHVYV